MKIGNLSDLFQRAHKRAKFLRCIYESYREAFSDALKYFYPVYLESISEKYALIAERKRRKMEEEIAREYFRASAISRGNNWTGD